MSSFRELTLLLLFPAVIPKVGYEVFFYTSFHVSQIAASVVFIEAIRHKIGDPEVLRDPLMYMTNRPVQRKTMVT